MAQPITWQTINAPSFGEANRLMGLAQQSILGAFDGAKTALADSQAFDKELWKRQDQDATQDVLGKIYQAQTVDQMNALNQSGVLDQGVAANGARIDRAAVNALRDGRVDTLQQRDLRGLKYGEDKLLLEQAGVTAEGLALAQKQDPVAFNAWLAANPQNRKLADVLNMNRTVQQSVEDQTFQKNQDTRAGNAETRAAEEQPLKMDGLRSNLLTAESQRNAQAAQAALATAQAEKYRADAKAAANANTPGSLIDARYKELVANGPWDKGTLDTAEGKSAFMKGLKELGLPQAAQEDVVAQVYKYYGKGAVVGFDDKGQPIRAPLGVSTALQAVGEAGGNTMVDSLFGWSRRGDQTANALDKMFGVYSTGEKNPAWQATKDNELIQKMQATLALRNQREQVLATPPEQVNYNGKNAKKQK